MYLLSGAESVVAGAEIERAGFSHKNNKQKGIFVHLICIEIWLLFICTQTTTAGSRLREKWLSAQWSTTTTRRRDSASRLGAFCPALATHHPNDFVFISAPLAFADNAHTRRFIYSCLSCLHIASARDPPASTNPLFRRARNEPAAESLC
jgi:hypothetical protein